MSHIEISHKERVATWEKTLARKEPVIEAVLTLDGTGKVNLQKALPDLEKRARGAIFWQGFRNVMTVSLPANDWFISHFYDVLYNPLWSRLIDDESDLISKIGIDIEALEFFSLKVEDAYWHDLWIFIDEKFVYSDFMIKRIAPALALIHGLTLFCAVEGHFKIVDKFRPLMELWKQGNFPLCTDLDHSLVVLVSED